MRTLAKNLLKALSLCLCRCTYEILYMIITEHKHLYIYLPFSYFFFCFIFLFLARSSVRYQIRFVCNAHFPYFICYAFDFIRASQEMVRFPRLFFCLIVLPTRSVQFQHIKSIILCASISILEEFRDFSSSWTCSQFHHVLYEIFILVPFPPLHTGPSHCCTHAHTFQRSNRHHLAGCNFDSASF